MSQNLRVLFPDGQVQVMDIEEYLRAVVPTEVSPSWHPEALKTQAVAARSYAAYAAQYARHADRGADICTTTHCQAYNPEKIHPNTDRAIAETAGQVMQYNGATINTVFSAACGGATRSSQKVWGGSVAYLQSVPCPCGRDKYGHGVGLCQWGAQRLAQSNYSYVDILQHYYRGAVVAGATVAPAPPNNIDSYLQAHAVITEFLGERVSGGFTAQDGNHLEFFGDGALIVTPSGLVTLAPEGAWIADLYRGKHPLFEPVAPRSETNNLYYDDLGHNLFGIFRDNWQDVYGRPVSEEFYLVVDNKAATCQMFEYALLLHNPNTNRVERVKGHLSRIFLSLIDNGAGLELIGRLLIPQKVRKGPKKDPKRFMHGVSAARLSAAAYRPR